MPVWLLLSVVLPRDVLPASVAGPGVAIVPLATESGGGGHRRKFGNAMKSKRFEPKLEHTSTLCSLTAEVGRRIPDLPELFANRQRKKVGEAERGMKEPTN